MVGRGVENVGFLLGEMATLQRSVREANAIKIRRVSRERYVVD